MEIGVVEIVTALGLLGGFIVSVISVVWRLSTLAGRIEKSENTAKLAHERLDKYVQKHENVIEELRRHINNIVQVQTRIEAKVSLLIEGKKLS